MTNTEKLPVIKPDFETKAKICEAVRNDSVPVIVLKTGKTGKGEGCPFACMYCDTDNKNGGYWLEFDEAHFRTMISNWANQGGKIMHWCGDGEPTIFKWFDTILDLAKEKGFKLELFSNLAGLTPSRARKLTEIGTTVKFKMDSRNPVTMGEILTNNGKSGNAAKTGQALFDNIDMLISARNKYENKSQLIASIVMSEKNKNDLPAVLDWCCKFNVVPQINYMEQIGAVIETGIEPLTKRETEDINRWLKIKYDLIDPKQIMGDHQCEAKAAPIIIGNKVYLASFGMGCEFVLREHIGELNFIGEYQNDPMELMKDIKKFRFSEQNLNDICDELEKIRDKKGIYSKTGTDKILPGCGDDIEEVWFLEYVATIFTSDEYFTNFINNWVLTGKHRKWTKEETQDLFWEVTDNFICFSRSKLRN